MKPDSPEACDRLFADCVARGDLDALLSLYEEAATFVREDGSCVNGRAAIREELSPLVAARPRMKMHVRRVVPAGADLALLFNDWTFSAAGEDGVVEPQAGSAMEIVRRQPDGSWRFVLDDPHGGHGAR